MLDISNEQMDVDLSSHTPSKMDISLDKTDELTEENTAVKTEKDLCTEMKCETSLCKQKPTGQRAARVKTFHIKINRRRVEKKFQPDMGYKLFTTGLIVIGLAILSHYTINFTCMDEMDIAYLNDTLNRNIFGQTTAVKAIVETLAMNISSKVMFFYGGTGIGKTFAASLILKNFWKSSNVYHYTMPSFTNTFSADFMLGLTLCKTSILVVDDLSPNDMNIKSHIVDFIAKSENLVKNVTVILIWNCDNITGNFVKKCDESFFQELKYKFGDIKSVKKFIKFDQLTEEHLIRCIEKELGNGLKEFNMDNIVKNFNVTLDGCKGVYRKIKLMNIV